MRVEPEKVLEQDRISTESWVKDANVEQPLDDDQRQGDGDNRRTDDKDNAGGIHRPDEQWQTKPRQARRTHLVNGYDKVQTGQDGGKPGDKDAGCGGHHVSVQVHRAQGRVEGPAGVNSACDQRVGHNRSAGHEDVPTQQVEARKAC